MIDLKKLSLLMQVNGIDGLIVMSYSNQQATEGTKNLYYSTGAAGFSAVGVAAIFPRVGEPVLICGDTGYEAIRRMTWIEDIRTIDDFMHSDRLGQPPRAPGPPGSKPQGPGMVDPFQTISDVAAEKRISKKKLGIEGETLSLIQYRRLRKALPEARLVDVSSPPLSSKTIWWQMRMIKSADEIDNLKKAIEISEAAIKAAMEVGSEWREKSVTIRDFQKAYLRFQVDSGYLPKGWPVSGRYVVTGKGPDDVLREGDILEVEFIAQYKGYTSDLHRDFAIGKPSGHALKLANALKTAQGKVKDAIRPGVKPSELFLIGQNTVREMGFPQYTRGHVGHGIGLGGEEPPFLSFQETEVLKQGMVLAVEIPYYIVGLHSMCPEDNGLVTEKGFESFSKLPRELISLPVKS